MKTMKITAFICLFLYICSNVSGQTSPFRFGAKTGLNLSSASVNDANASKFKAGYHVGVTVEYELPRDFLIQSGLFFSTKGSKQEDLNGSGYVGGKPDFTHTFNQLYLEIPIFGAYRMGISDKINLVLGVGPYLAYGIGGKTKQKLNSGVWADGKTEIEWDTFGDGVYDNNRDWLKGESLNRFDFGGGFKADLEYSKYTFGVGLTSSIINISKKEGYSDSKYRNVNVSISLGYKL